jgi:hypothetical protein
MESGIHKIIRCHLRHGMHDFDKQLFKLMLLLFIRQVRELPEHSGAAFRTSLHTNPRKHIDKSEIITMTQPMFNQH